MSFPTRLPEHTDVYFTKWRWPPESGAFITLSWRTQTVSALGCFRLGNTDFDFKIRIPDFTIKHEIRFRISTDRNPFSRRILSIKVPYSAKLFSAIYFQYQNSLPCPFSFFVNAVCLLLTVSSYCYQMAICRLLVGRQILWLWGCLSVSAFGICVEPRLQWGDRA